MPKLLERDFGKENHNGLRYTIGDWTGKNKSGWAVIGEVQEDYFVWMDSFTARHKEYGTVKGSFEGIIKFTSKKGLEHFMKHHGPHEWDMGDI